jgi:hypothetical protein
MLQYVNRLNSYRMATLILYLSTCLSRMTRGERRLAGPLEQKSGAAYPSNARKEGHAWGDMAVLCFDTKTCDLYRKTT